MSGLQWLILFGCWLIAGVGWCVMFAALGLRYELKFEVPPTVTEDDLESAQNDLASAA